MDVSSHAPADIRRLWQADAASFRDHLLRLDSVSRRQRFGGGMSDDFLVHYAENCFGQGDLVFGAFIEGVMRGAAELRSSRSDLERAGALQHHIHAEAAFSVEEPYRRRGVGETTVPPRRAAASNHGVETIEIVCAARQYRHACVWPANSRPVSPSRKIAHRPIDRAPPTRLLADARGDRATSWISTSAVFERALRAPTSARRDRARDAALEPPVGHHPLMWAIALAGLRPFGQVLAQFMIVWQR